MADEPARTSKLWWWLAGVVALVAFAFAARLYLASPSEWAQGFVDANPAWRIERELGGRFIATELASGVRIRIPDDEVGGHAMRRVPCAQMALAHPPWFRLPPGSGPEADRACVQLSSAGHDVYLVNFASTLGVPAIWSEFYEPLVAEYPFDAWGGESTSPATSYRHLSNQVVYGIAPRFPDGSREAHLSAFYVEGQTVVVLALRVAAP